MNLRIPIHLDKITVYIHELTVTHTVIPFAGILLREIGRWNSGVEYRVRFTQIRVAIHLGIFIFPSVENASGLNISELIFIRVNQLILTDGLFRKRESLCDNKICE